MGRKKNNYKANTYYHIFNRGHNKKRVFRQQIDNVVFIKYLYKYSKRYNITVDSYCIMRNHYHLILKTGSKPKDLSRMMQAFLTKFSKYINNKYKMVGAVFQGRYKKREVKDFEDLIMLRRYLRQNPVKDGFVVNPDDYKWMRLGGHTSMVSDT
jgi:REP element-mobilizing transposase RayT